MVLTALHTVLRDKFTLNPSLSYIIEMNCHINTYQFKLRYRIQNCSIEERASLQHGDERSDNVKRMST
jgi:hypothetical protein